jgi:hypothetical protein
MLVATFHLIRASRVQVHVAKSARSILYITKSCYGVHRTKKDAYQVEIVYEYVAQPLFLAKSFDQFPQPTNSNDLYEQLFRIHCTVLENSVILHLIRREF